MLDNKNIAQNMETRLDQAFTSKMKERHRATLEEEAKALERDEECDRPISIQFRAIVAISHKNREEGEGRGREGGKAINIELQRGREL